MYAWEGSCKEKIEATRREELSWLQSNTYLQAVNSAILNVVPVLVSVLTFAVFAFSGHTLTPTVAFTSLALFKVMRMPLFTFPNLITNLTNCQVAIGRLQEMIRADEQPLAAFPALTPDEPAVEIRNGAFTWDVTAEADPTLSKINLTVPQGQLVVVIGSAGEGKSSLLNAILGEMPSVATGPDTAHTIKGKVAYVPQKAWIFNDTVERNVTFGVERDEARFQAALDASCLRSDLEQLAAAERTEIGERGINVSGGQKQRISIARAVYSAADTYIFDDPLSALDAAVAKGVWEKCICEALHGKTRLVATNQLQFLGTTPGQYIVMVGNGGILAQGAYEDLYATPGPFANLMDRTQTAMKTANEEEERDTGDEEASGEEAEDGAGGKTKQEAAKPAGAEAGAALVTKESKEAGHVSLRVVGRYVTAMGGSWACWLLMILFVAIEVMRVGASLWISHWSAVSKPNGTGTSGSHPIGYYIGIYAAISMAQVVGTFSNSFWTATIQVRAACFLHEGMLSTVLRAPMSFFWANPLGRIINRFSKDMSDIDRNIASFTATFLRGGFNLLSTLIVVSYTTPFVLTVIVPLLGIFYYLYQVFQSSVREIKRLDAVTRSPIYVHFNQAMDGLNTIHAFRAHHDQLRELCKRLDGNIRMNLATMSANRWLSVRQEFLGSTMILGCAVFTVIQRGHSPDAAASAGMGLTLSYALSITALMTMTMRLASLAENSFNAVERVGEYSEAATVTEEAPLKYDDPARQPPPSWPSKGAVSFSNVSMRYRSGTPLVLKDFTAQIQGGERIGVVGRTGAGKSTLFNSLFRIVEIEAGSITIDGVNCRELGLHDLRSKMSIIPQEPVLFMGTVRSNLDPFDQHSDAEVWQALERSNLKPLVGAFPAKLLAPVEADGANFSVGQRQLISLSRALLRRSRILVLDEATASIDVETDALIQETIRTSFKGSTMLIIAHRLNTIIDSDRIIVMDRGELVEHGTPLALLDKPLAPKGFRKLVESTGPEMHVLLYRIAEAKAQGDTDSCTKLHRVHSQLQEKAETLVDELSNQNQSLRLELTANEASLQAAREALTREKYKGLAPVLSRSLAEAEYPQVVRIQESVAHLRRTLGNPGGLGEELRQLQVPPETFESEVLESLLGAFPEGAAGVHQRLPGGAGGGLAAAYSQEVADLVTQLYHLVAQGGPASMGGPKGSAEEAHTVHDHVSHMGL